MRSTFLIFLVSLVFQLGCTALAAFGFLRVPFQKRAFMQYGVICSIAGFLGDPLAEGILGSDGLMLASIYLIPQRIVMWSVGLGYFSESNAAVTAGEKRSIAGKCCAKPLPIRALSLR